MSGSDDALMIRPEAKKNGITCLAIGCAGGGFSLLLFAILPTAINLSAIFLLSASIVAILIGWFKLREPEHSMVISRQDIAYYHRVGKWSLTWKNIIRIDTPRVSHGIDLRELDLIGIKINEYAPFLDSISPRLASHLLMEQRALLLQNDNCKTGQFYSESLIENDTFKFADGRVITGIKAMFANRMRNLRERLGYDIFISSAELDRSKDEFVSLLRQCQNQVRLHHQDH
ncbi:DUF2982 domain-containing protein [Aestuariibacter sp. AA17]|uniref:DUF2982 domain-containing protein n=1 Tax=Fluctibacter corallii TaxID=2984329 RepID=A0ABT3ACN8_9ALTE|nr:DUF2982 domain-containing protein [Aestuariibacter sp. AA17]MCV2886448.1 DUF2982 domain-containing protein [Aestuariibacter sp. AA17]